MLQTRVQVLNDDLRDTFCRWFTGMNTEERASLKGRGIEVQPPDCSTLLIEHCLRQHIKECSVVLPGWDKNQHSGQPPL
ncbi:MAG: hypothetical protein MUO63_17420 [Desulfobulbaceae bacterium]|nr:hypothetical protein [Desulfobulbaceae bacterium]